MTMRDAEQVESTRQHDLPGSEPAPPLSGDPGVGYQRYDSASQPEVVHRPTLDAATSAQPVVYVPLAVTVGDGFKFGCGFFLASVLTMLVGFVLLAALFALTAFMGIDLPVGR